MENIRPIKTEADYDWAIAEITRYFENEPEVGSADGDRFDVLATLIEAYEDGLYALAQLSGFVAPGGAAPQSRRSA